jgi:hypothetical protein
MVEVFPRPASPPQCDGRRPFPIKGDAPYLHCRATKQLFKKFLAPNNE